MSRIRHLLATILLALAASGSIALEPGPAAAKVAADAGASGAQYARFDAAIEATKAAMMGDPQAALTTARAAAALARRLPASNRADIARATASWLEAEALLGTNDVAAAAPLAQQALALVERVQPGGKLHGDLLRSHGAIASMQGDVAGALDDYQRAFAVFEQAGVPRSQAIVLQDIGQIYADAGDYPKVLRHYAQALEIYDDDPALNLTTHNNRGETYREQGEFDSASAEFRNALAAAQQLGSPMLQVRILTNLAGSESEAGRYVAARSAIGRALAMSGQGEAAGWRPFIFAMQARIAAAQGDVAGAAVLFNRAFAGIDLASSEMPLRDYHKVASQVYEATGQQSLALAHFKAYQRLDSEADALTASIASQLASAQFDFAAQDLRIARLNEEKLQKDIAARTTLFIVLAAGSGVILLVLSFGFLSVRRSRNQVRAANDTLTDTNVALEKALHAKTEFLAMTSHEIRTPLNGILGMTQVLLADRRVADDLRTRIEVVNSAGETMRALVDDILDVAKMESGELTIAQERTDLAAILRETGQLWSGQAEAKGLEIALDIGQAPPMIMGDGGRIRQIVFNLMSNALKFTLSGGVTLAVTAEAADGAPECLRIEVSDTGIGIPEDMLEVIFESFKQVDAGTTRQFSGTGLGLAICRQLTEAMGGTIFASNNEEAGTTFTVILPLVRVADEAAAGGGGGGLPDLSHYALAAVLPRDDTAVLLRMSLMAEAGSISFGATLEEAIALLSGEPIDQMLFDAACVTAPDGDGAGALRALVAACDEAGTKLSLMLAKDGPVSPATAMMLGAAQIIIQPISLDQLLPALRSVHSDIPDMFVAPALLAAHG